MTREISVDLTPQAQVGDYVLVHARLRPSRWWTSSSPLETIELVKPIPELADLNEAPTPA